MRLKVSINKKELLASGLLCLLGLAAVLQVSASAVGRATGLGAGMLPVLLGSMLMMGGILWLFNSRLSPDEEEDAEIGSSIWRGCCGVASGIFAFMILGRYVGIVPGVFAMVFIIALGDYRHSWKSALVLALASAAIAAIGLFFFAPIFLSG